jgi:hypothetical protein
MEPTVIERKDEGEAETESRPNDFYSSAKIEERFMAFVERDRLSRVKANYENVGLMQ